MSLGTFASTCLMYSPVRVTEIFAPNRIIFSLWHRLKIILFGANISVSCRHFCKDLMIIPSAEIICHGDECSFYENQISGLAQDCSNSSALAVELLQSCTKSLKWLQVISVDLSNLSQISQAGWNWTLLSSIPSEPLWCWSQNIPGELGQHCGSWCPGSWLSLSACHIAMA